MAFTVNKRAVADAFGRAAQRYHEYAQLQQLSGDTLMALTDTSMALTDTSACHSLLDAGCGTGRFSQLWRERGLQVTALDLSPAMLAEASRRRTANHYLCGDIDALPLADAAVDLCWSNLALQWCENLHHALNQCCRVTRTGGKVLFSTLAADSLKEMRAAWYQLDGVAHVNRFRTLEQIHAAVAGKKCQLSQQCVTLAFPDVMAAMYSVKGIGATHLHHQRSKGLMTRRHLQRLAHDWQRDQRGYLLSYYLVFGVIDCD